MITHDPTELLRARAARLRVSVERGRSVRWTLRLWSLLVRERDGYRCVSCGGVGGLQAHHIVRKTLYPWGAFEPGNGITLCRECHGRIHEHFNGRPSLTLPLGAENGDDQDEWAYLFGLLVDDSTERGLDPDEFYFLGDHMLMFFVRCQGYAPLLDSVKRGEISRIWFAHQIWRSMPEQWYTNVVSEIVRLNLSV